MTLKISNGFDFLNIFYGLPHLAAYILVFPTQDTNYISQFSSTNFYP